MSWHHFPHMPSDGDRILVKLKGCEEGNYFEMTITQLDSVGHIEKWCYWEDYQEILERKLRG